MYKCLICNKDEGIQDHHLIPKALHKKLRKKKLHRKLDLQKTISLCNCCHCNLHREFSEKELYSQMPTIEQILNNSLIKKWIIFKNKTHKNIY